MNIETRKIEFLRKFLELKDEELILKLEQLLGINGNNTDSLVKEEIEPFTIAELNERIDKSEKDFKNSRFKTTDELIKKYNL